MNIFNKKMFQLVSTLIENNNKLDTGLSDLFADDFTSISDCFLLTKFHKENNQNGLTNFIDKTGYECFINSFHIDDYINCDFLIQAILFSKKLFDEWEKLNNSLLLEVIMSETDFGVNIKFHVLRENEIWININDIENFEEALMICRNN